MKQNAPYAISLNPASSLRNHTGSWRVQMPIYVERLPPCNHACPAGENIQQWLYHAEEGRFEDAWREITKANPFPAIHGRVCYHPCESACNRVHVDEAVSIHQIERFLGDKAIAEGWQITPAADTGQRVLVVGAGPSGLSCAFHLRRAGHAVTLLDGGDKPGGMMRYGIPAYRLPRNILDAEIDRLRHMGVDFRMNTRVEKLIDALVDEGNNDRAFGDYDAVFVATGAHVSRRVDIPGCDAGRVIDAVSFLREMEGDDKPIIGRRVAVYGGGNTAMDAARTAKRLGADSTVLIYRRNQEKMPAHEEEWVDASEEGVVAHWLRTVKSMDAETIEVEVMELDADGWPTPTGRTETIEADTLILALGQVSDTAFLDGIEGVVIGKNGVVEVDATLMTGKGGLFAGGDLVPGERTVTTAVGHGRRAAAAVNAFLKRANAPLDENGKALATYERLNTWYYTDAPAHLQPRLDRQRRLTTFEEINQPLDEESAVFESRRCMSCGNCFECDNCYGMCPDNAIIKLGPGKGFEINYDYCKGCGICANECPCGAIDMVEETR